MKPACGRYASEWWRLATTPHLRVSAAHRPSLTSANVQINLGTDKHRSKTGARTELQLLKDESFPKTEKTNKWSGSKNYAFLRKINEGAKPDWGVRGRSPRNFLESSVNKD